MDKIKSGSSSRETPGHSTTLGKTPNVALSGLVASSEEATDDTTSPLGTTSEGISSEESDLKVKKPGRQIGEFYPENISRRKKSKLKEIIIISVLIVFLVILIALIFQFLVAKKKKEKEKDRPLWNNDRLPSFISPIHYDVFINPNIEISRSVGNVTIFFNVTKNSEFIILNVQDLDRIVLRLKKNNEAIMTTYKLYKIKNEDQMHIKVNGILKPTEEYRLEITFRGQILVGFLGFVIFQMRDNSYVALSQHYPSLARKVFPCFDEPAMKATFQLTIVYSNKYKVISNTEIKSTSSFNSNSNITVFEKTPKISPHIFAFAIFNFTVINKIDDKVNLRFFTYGAEFQEFEYALNSFVTIQKYFNNLFGIKHPSLKLDILAVPGYSYRYNINFDLIICDSRTLTYDSKNPFTTVFIGIDNFISFALATQWFGILTTAESWFKSPLDQGLATYFQYDALTHCYPERDMMHLFPAFEMQNTLYYDSKKTAQEIYAENEYHKKPSGRLITDGGSKFAAILRMLESVLGKETFLKGIRIYLKKYLYANTDFENVWTSLMEVDKSLNLSKLMNTWIYRIGYPVIHAELFDRSVRLRQRHFRTYSKKSDGNQSSDNYKWSIPVTYITSSNKNQSIYWLLEETGEFKLDVEDKWIKLNVLSTGFYRVMYNEELWNSLSEELQTNHEIFSPSDRANLMDDAFAFEGASWLKLGFVLNMSSYLKKEKHFAPWVVAKYAFPSIYRYLRRVNISYAARIYNFFFELMEPHKRDPEKEKLPVLALLLSNLIKELGDKLEIAATEKHRVEASYKKSLRSLRKVQGDNCWKEYNKYKLYYKTHLTLFTGTTKHDVERLRNYLPFVLRICKIRTEDLENVFLTIRENDQFGQEVWSLIKADFSKFVKICEKSPILSFLITSALSNFHTQSQYDEVKSYVPQITTKNLKKEIFQALEKIQVNIIWKSKVERSIGPWIGNNI